MPKRYIAEPVSRRWIRGLVRYIREKTDTQDDLYFDVVRFLEINLPQMIKKFHLEIMKVSDMPNKVGETFPAECKICIREDIYEKALEGDGYARFGIAHEIGHLLINDMDSISLCRLEKGEKIRAFEDPEWQADCFGGELLMYHPLIKDLSVEEITEKCGVTSKAANTQFSKI
jgi:Zn-dependent peptidase ImmA (M78 family)